MNRYFQTPPVVLNLIIINALVFLASFLLPPVGEIIFEYGSLYSYGSPEFHSYQLVTSMFLHGGGMWHLFFNMFMLWMFGRSLEYELGSKRFLIYYMICGVGAGLIQLGVAFWAGDNISLTGASGAVMGVLMAFGVLHPNAIIMLVIPPMPIKAKWFVLICIGLELLFEATGIQASVAHFAHLGGMLFGFLLLHWWKWRGIIRF